MNWMGKARFNSSTFAHGNTALLIVDVATQGSKLRLPCRVAICKSPDCVLDCQRDILSGGDVVQIAINVNGVAWQRQPVSIFYEPFEAFSRLFSRLALATVALVQSANAAVVTMTWIPSVHEQPDTMSAERQVSALGSVYLYRTLLPLRLFYRSQSCAAWLCRTFSIYTMSELDYSSLVKRQLADVSQLNNLSAPTSPHNLVRYFLLFAPD